MTPAQRSALESLAARTLMVGEIAALEPLLAIRDDVAIAALLSTGRVTVVSHRIGELGILDLLGPVAGDAFLAALEASTGPEALPEGLRPYCGAIRRGVAWLKTDGLDVGAGTTRVLLDALAAGGVLDGAAVLAIKASAERASPIPYAAVSDVLNVAEGRLTLGG